MELILNRLRQDGDIEDAVSPNFLARNWPPAFKEWSTKSVRDAFFASPQFPRLLNSESLKDTIATRRRERDAGLRRQEARWTYAPFHWKSSLTVFDVELSDDMYIIQRETAEAYAAGKSSADVDSSSATADSDIRNSLDSDQSQRPVRRRRNRAYGSAVNADRVTWQGDVPPQKWMNFYTKVLSKFATQTGLKIALNVEIAPEGGVSNQKVDEIKVALRELGLSDDVTLE